VDLHELAKDKREDMVLKPVSGYGGKDVLIGRHTMPTVWNRTMHDARDGEYVLQEFVDIPKASVPAFDSKGRLRSEDKYCNLNFYVLDGELVGTLGRLSDSPVVNIAQGGGMASVFSVKQIIWSHGVTDPVGDETDPQ
jgi:glutathione synthase/RimK-type ligase-like ATP-grasp enzyme